MRYKDIRDVTFEDIENMVSSGLQEGKYLEFKRDLIGSSERDKREFLADVSSFANSEGGEILIGVEEEEGKAKGFYPIGVKDADAEILRLSNIIQNGLEPRLAGVDVVWLAGNDRGVILVRIQRSWQAPHRVVFNKDMNFYSRASGGKYPMDTHSLRQAFGALETAQSRARLFRQERGAYPCGSRPRCTPPRGEVRDPNSTACVTVRERNTEIQR